MPTLNSVKSAKENRQVIFYGIFFNSNGHGVHYVTTPPYQADITIVTGPRRGAVMPHLPNAHAAAPHGDMMLSGSFGLLDGFAYRFPQAQEFVDGLHGP